MREFAAIEKDPRAFYEGLLNALETAEKNLKDAPIRSSLEVRGVTEEEANEERERGGGGRKRRQAANYRGEKKRAKLMAMHAGNKETLDEVEAEEKQNATDKGFGDGEDDWSMYSQMARGADKAIDGEIKDPGAQKVSACESLWEKASRGLSGGPAIRNPKIVRYGSSTIESESRTHSRARIFVSS